MKSIKKLLLVLLALNNLNCEDILVKCKLLYYFYCNKYNYNYFKRISPLRQI